MNWRKEMNTTQLKVLMKHCKRLKIKTLGELEKFKEHTKAMTNKQLLFKLIFTRKVNKDECV